MTAKHHYLVTGRIIGDDEDTAHAFEASSAEEAMTLYRTMMYEAEGIDAAEQEKLVAVGEGCMVNAVFRSASPIEEV